MTTATASTTILDFPKATIHRNLPAARLIEIAIQRGEGVLASNGALNVDTGQRTGRSPKDKYLEDTPTIHSSIDWGKVNVPISPENFAKLEQMAIKHLSNCEELFRFDGLAGAQCVDRNPRSSIAGGCTGVRWSLRTCSDHDRREGE